MRTHNILLCQRNSKRFITIMLPVSIMPPVFHGSKGVRAIKGRLYFCADLDEFLDLFAQHCGLICSPYSFKPVPLLPW